MHATVQHVPHVIQALAPTIDTYGYFAVGGLLVLEDFGIPVPGETVLIAAAFYAGLGELHILLVAIVGILAAIIGDNIGFTIGRYGGRPIVEKLGKYVLLTPARLDQAEAFFNRHGGKVVMAARFIEGLRQLNGIIAGLSEMHWRKFIVFNAVGATLWVGFWSVVGYYGGSHIETFLRYQLYVSISVVAVIIGYFLFCVLRRKQNNSR